MTPEISAPHSPLSKSILEIVASACKLITVSIFICCYLVQIYEVPSGSMEPTLLIGDRILVNKTPISLARSAHVMIGRETLKRGDVIVFLSPSLAAEQHGETVFVKRIAGLSGDRLHLTKGVLYVNGVKQDGPYALKPREDGNPNDSYNPFRDDFPAVLPQEGDTSEGWLTTLPMFVHAGEIVIPEGDLFVLGDNRTGSLDSRMWGFVHATSVLGRVGMIYWSGKPGEIQGKKDGLALGPEIRWDRFLLPLR